MARLGKDSLNFFQLETSIVFDPRIRKLMRKHGTVGFSAYVFVSALASYENGYYVDHNDLLEENLSEDLGVDETTVRAIIEYMCQLDLFDLCTWEKHKVLTSASAQSAWKRHLSKRQKAKLEDIKLAYSLVEQIEVSMRV